MSTIDKAIEALLEDSTVTEIMVDGPDRVYVEREGKLEDVSIRFVDEQAVIDWANGLLAEHGWSPAGKDQPWVEGYLRDGSHILVIIPPVAVSGPSVVIHKRWRNLITFDQLIEWGSLSQPILDFMKAVMQARLSVVIAGGTASGKTTLTRMMLELIPETERLIAIGQPGPLRLHRKRLVSLESQASGIDTPELLRLAGRLRPDRIVVSRLEGSEVIEMLRLMNTGYEGMVATMHANSPRDALTRLETMATVEEPSLTLPVIRGQIASAVNLIFHLSQVEDGSRKILSIAEVQGLKGDSIVLQDLFTWQKTGMGEDGRFTGVFKATGAVPSFASTLAAAGLTFPDGIFEA